MRIPPSTPILGISTSILQVFNYYFNSYCVSPFKSSSNSLATAPVNLDFEPVQPGLSISEVVRTMRESTWMRLRMKLR